MLAQTFAVDQMALRVFRGCDIVTERGIGRVRRMADNMLCEASWGERVAYLASF